MRPNLSDENVFYPLKSHSLFWLCANDEEDFKGFRCKTFLPPTRIPESILPNFDFLIFPFFTFKLGHFKVLTIFSHATNTQA